VSNHISSKAIQSFWDWFATIADRLGDNFEDSQLLGELSARVSTLGNVSWELGPGTDAENALAISPDGDPDLLPLTQRIVSMAPTLFRWEFLSARPARAVALAFSIATSGGRDISIDAQPWRYVLFRFPNETFDLVLEQNNLVAAADDDRYTAAVVLLDGLLGEATRLLRIHDIEPVVALRSDLEPKATNISMLPAHLRSLS
jgi:hypothetical protein